jgi:hypothetical protein
MFIVMKIFFSTNKNPSQIFPFSAINKKGGGDRKQRN